MSNRNRQYAGKTTATSCDLTARSFAACPLLVCSCPPSKCTSPTPYSLLHQLPLAAKIRHPAYLMAQPGLQWTPLRAPSSRLALLPQMARGARSKQLHCLSPASCHMQRSCQHLASQLANLSSSTAETALPCLGPLSGSRHLPTPMPLGC